MFDVIDITCRLRRKKAETEGATEKRSIDTFLSLSSELSEIVKKYQTRYGATYQQIIGASLVILARAIALHDPEMKMSHLRDIIHETVDKEIDEQLMRLWTSDDVLPGE